MTDELNRAIRRTARKPEPTHKDESMAPEVADALAREKELGRQSAVMNRALRAAAGVPNESEPPATNSNDAKETQ